MIEDYLKHHRGAFFCTEKRYRCYSQKVHEMKDVEIIKAHEIDVSENST